jgi:hypothetical protein
MCPIMHEVQIVRRFVLAFFPLFNANQHKAISKIFKASARVSAAERCQHGLCRRKITDVSPGAMSVERWWWERSGVGAWRFFMWIRGVGG